MKRIKLIVSLIAVFLLSPGCDLKHGFIESEFSLAANSRLPYWTEIPAGMSRKDIMIRIICYTHPFHSDTVKVIVYGPEKRIIEEKIGKERWHPLTESQIKNSESGLVFPNYSIIKIDGKEEIYEQRTLEPILYITNNPPNTTTK
ncbi:hypothetical protein JXA40_08220 [bacterium]|nr:hypothetical protein [candidate division CSSED10-310 bacterium]